MRDEAKISAQRRQTAAHRRRGRMAQDPVERYQLREVREGELLIEGVAREGRAVLPEQVREVYYAAPVYVIRGGHCRFHLDTVRLGRDPVLARRDELLHG